MDEPFAVIIIADVPSNFKFRLEYYYGKKLKELELELDLILCMLANYLCIVPVLVLIS